MLPARAVEIEHDVLAYIATKIYVEGLVSRDYSRCAGRSRHCELRGEKTQKQMNVVIRWIPRFLQGK